MTDASANTTIPSRTERRLNRSVSRRAQRALARIWGKCEDVYYDIRDKIEDAYYDLRDRSTRRKPKYFTVHRTEPLVPLGGEATDDQHEDAPRSQGWWAPVLSVLLIGTVALAIVAFAGWFVGSRVNSVPPTKSGKSSQASVPATAPAVATTTQPVADFVIAMPRRDGHRLNADGVKVHDNAEAFRAQIAYQTMHDPLSLMLYYNFSPLGERDPIQNVADLCKDGIIKDGNVYSEEGKKRYNEWIILWGVTEIKSVREITFQGTNTGVDGTSVTKSNGVSGKDKAGYDIDYKDAQGNSTGNKHSALERCTQPTGKGVPGVPEGKTDNPKPNPKDATKNIERNPDVADWKKDGGDRHQVNGTSSSVADEERAIAERKRQAEAERKRQAEEAAKAREKAKDEGGGDNNTRSTVPTG